MHFINEMTKEQIKRFLTDYQNKGKNKICNDLDSLADEILDSIQKGQSFEISFSTGLDINLRLEDFGIYNKYYFGDEAEDFEEAWVKFLHNEFGMDYYLEFFNVNQIALDAVYA